MFPPEYVRRHAAMGMAAHDRARLHLLVLEGGQALLARARAALERGDAAAFAADLQRTQAVVLELVRTLDRTAGGAIVGDLERLHERMVGGLALADARGTLERVDELLRAWAPVVEALRDVVRSGGERG